MALETYTDLQDAITGWLNRTGDTDTIARIPDFIRLCEAALNRELRTRRQVTTSYATIDAERSALPDDFLSVISLDLDGSPNQTLQGISPAEMLDQRQVYNAPSKPRYYTIDGGELRFGGSPDTDYTANLTYYARIPALSDAAPTNWVLQYHPDAYLYGSLIHSAPYLREDERIPTWLAGWGKAIQDIQAADARESYGGRLRARIRPIG
jgi:hypothetical protein